MSEGGASDKAAIEGPTRYGCGVIIKRIEQFLDVSN